MEATPSYVLCVGLTPALQRILQFPALRLGEVNRATAVRETIGGKGASVARALARLGTRPLLIGLNGGETGRRIEAQLMSEGVPFEFAPTAAPTRVCQTLLCGATGEATELVEEAPRASAGEWAALLAVFGRLVAGASWLAISGNLPRGGEGDIYARLVAQAAGHGVPVLIDSSGPPLLGCLPHRPAVAKLNAHELGLTFGAHPASPAEMVALARRLLEGGAQAAVITDGPRGVWLIEPRRVTRFQPPSIQAVNPIGSGDAVSAGTIHRLLAGAPLPDAVRLGVACGTANALALEQAGFTQAEALHLAGQVEINDESESL